jgi:hypothetical protein
MKHVILLLALFSCFPAFAQVDHWETIVFEDDSWRYLVPTSPVTDNWVQPGFDDSSWSLGPGGFGYGDGDDNTTLSPTLACFQRISFQVTNRSLIGPLVVNVDYDDAFVLYLNGTEIGRENISSPGIPPYNQAAGGLHEAELYQGGYPSQIVIDEVAATSLLRPDTNVLAIQTHNESLTSSDMSSRVWVHVGILNSSNTYGTPPAWFIPPANINFTSSNLPIVVIETQGQQIPDEPKITAEMGIINNGPGNRNQITDPYNEYDGFIGIEIRGSSSQAFPKKQYGIETRDSTGDNNNVPLFGWPKENDWVLYAPYTDKSLMRNVLSYDFSNMMGRWAPRTQFCELVLNGQYMGVYVFMEKIKRDKGRVDIAGLSEKDTVGDELTGGYILKLDKTTGGDPIAWTSPYPPIPGSMKVTQFLLDDPEWDELHPRQQTYIQDHITDFEDALSSTSFRDPLLGYLPYIDRGSFIDFLISNEISKNVDGYRLSTFFYKEKDSDGGKLVMGPIWDFNLAWGNANYCEGGEPSGWELDFNLHCPEDTWVNPFWWNRMVREDTAFANALACRWDQLRQGPLHTDSMLAYVDQQVALLNESQARNFQRWALLGTYVWPNRFVGNTYAEEVDYLKDWIRDRMAWLDANMFGNCGGQTANGPLSQQPSLSFFPNPAREFIIFQAEGMKGGEQLVFYSHMGQRLHTYSLTSSRLYVPIGDLAPGMYYYSLERKGERLLSGKWLKMATN